MYLIFALFASLYLYVINNMTNTLCVTREIPEEKQPKVFHTINILVTILITSSFVRIFLT